MAVTRATDVFSPELLAELIDTRLYNRTEVLNTPYVRNMTASAGASNGKSVDIPYFTGDMSVQEWNGTTLTSDKLTLDSKNVILKQGAVNLTNDVIALRLMGDKADPDTVMADYVGQKIQEHILREIYAQIDAEATANTVLSGNATLKDFTKASIVSFGDNAANVKPLVIANPKVMYDVQQDPKVQTAVQYGVRNDETMWLEMAGFNWAQSGLVKFNDNVSPAADTYNSYILLPDSVMFYVKLIDDTFGDTVRIPNSMDLNTVFGFTYAAVVKPGAYIPVASLTSPSSLG